MARLLLGVTGGIAAYKAAETARLAVRAGHAVRVIQTPTSERFIGRATFEGITGAPVLISEFDHDPSRGAFPGDPRPDRAPISHLGLVENADVYLIAPGERAHDRQARARPRRQSRDDGCARGTMSGRRRSGDERADVRTPGDGGQSRAGENARGHRDRTRNRRARLTRGIWDRTSRGTVGAGGDLRAAAGAADLERSARAGRPPEERGSRSTACATSAIAHPAGWGWPSPTRRRSGEQR